MSKSLGAVKEYIHNGELDGVLQELYVDEKSIPSQRERYENALDQFKELFGEKEIEIYSAAGRSEIGGNHTDHQNGKVLAASINLDAIGVVSKREDTTVRLQSAGYRMITLDLKDLEKVEREEGTTTALIRGVANGMKQRGYQIGGFDAYVTSSVLSGSGLSSSAAFEVLIGNILSGLYNECKLSSVEIAQIGQEAENVYFGKPCGLMDQMACSVGGLIFIDFADPQNPVVKKVDVKFSKFHHSLCIVDTKGSHADLTDEYAAIPAEMKKVAAIFGKNLLCEVNEEEFISKLPEVRKKCGDRCVLRAMHWFEENRRVEAQVAALERDSIEDFKKKIKESGDSSYKFLQNVFSVKKLQEQSVSVALAVSERLLGEKGVCRVHGGGFAGTIQAFVPSDMVEEYKNGMEAVFGEESCHVLQIREDGGRKVL
ncbi:MAG: galactokinase [Muricoprocola sp.]